MSLFCQHWFFLHLLVNQWFQFSIYLICLVLCFKSNLICKCSLSSLVYIRCWISCQFMGIPVHMKMNPNQLKSENTSICILYSLWISRRIFHRCLMVIWVIFNRFVWFHRCILWLISMLKDTQERMRDIIYLYKTLD